MNELKYIGKSLLKATLYGLPMAVIFEKVKYKQSLNAIEQDLLIAYNKYCNQQAMERIDDQIEVHVNSIGKLIKEKNTLLLRS